MRRSLESWVLGPLGPTDVQGEKVWSKTSNKLLSSEKDRIFNFFSRNGIWEK